MIKFYKESVLILVFLQIAYSETTNSKNSTSKCPLYYWQCNNGDCIKNEEVCDGTYHCSDRSDETVKECLQRPCPNYAFECAYGACITGNYKCNGIVNCIDGSDETRFLCDTDLDFAKEIQGMCIFSSSMQCTSGECINSDKACDGRNDCRDGSDETVELCSFLNCPDYSFRCGYGACITGSAKCNGIVDCKDGSDEISKICSKDYRPSINYNETMTTIIKVFPTTTVQPIAFSTTTSRPIYPSTIRIPTTGIPKPSSTASKDIPQSYCSSNSIVTNNYNTSDSSLNCPLYYWQCSNGDCIRNEQLCDGIIHCADRSDETVEECLLRPCPKYAFECAYGACITGNYKCNGIDNCLDRSDETKFLCDSDLDYMQEIQGSCNSHSNMQCKSGECIINDKVCDGRKDCRDGSDETVEICSFQKCPEYSFRCGYGACISGSAKCNGIVDCMDGSDELPRICGVNCNINVNNTPVATTTIKPIILSTTPSVVPTQKPPAQVPSTSTTNLPLPPNNYCSANTLTRGISTIISSCSYMANNVSCSQNLRPGTIANVMCAPGFIEKRHTKVHKTLICDNDGEWNHSKGKCTPDCGTLSEEQQVDLIKPWEVTIFKRSYIDLYNPICSGVIVSPKVVLTAANCFITLQDGHATDHIVYNVIEGFYNSTYSQSDQLNVAVYNLSRISIKNTPNTEDLAILILVNYFRFSNYLKPICLPSIKNNVTLLSDNRFNVGRPVMRDTSKSYLEYLIARVDSTYYARPEVNINYINIYYYLTFIQQEIRRYRYIL